MWRACLSLMLLGMLRGAEVGLDDSNQEFFEESQHVTRNDVMFSHKNGTVMAAVRMRKRKDLRMLRGKHDVVYVCECAHGHVDAVTELSRWVAAHAEKWPAQHALFVSGDGKMISTSVIRGKVKRLMHGIGLDPALYGAHSLRIGGATAALAAGVPPNLIRLMGRWSSEVYEIYCRMSLEAALRVSTQIATADVTVTERRFAFEELELLPEEIDRVEAQDNEIVADGTGRVE